MIGAISEAPAARLPGLLPCRGTDQDLVRLIVLRELEDSGPLTGMETLNAVASLACYLDVARPVYALLHELRDDGLVSASAGDRPATRSASGAAAKPSGSPRAAGRGCATCSSTSTCASAACHRVTPRPCCRRGSAIGRRPD